MIQSMKENICQTIPRQKEVADKRMNTLASLPSKENRNMRQTFSVCDQGPSHGIPHKLVHYKDPNFSREMRNSSFSFRHNKRRTDMTVW